MFDVFLSYSRSDHAVVETIAQALRARELQPFLDRWHLAGGQPWQDVLAARLADCRSVVVFVGPGGMGSWQNREKQRALDRQANEPGFPVIPVLLPGVEDPALDFLGLNTWVDLRGDVSNSDNLDALAAAINGEPPAAVDATADPRASICPYRGLQPFREEDAGFFFGRDAFAEKLLKKLENESFLAVVGASGSGKSSVVRAGLVPRLRAGANDQVWDVITIVPGSEPLQALAQAFDPPAAELGRIEAIGHINRGAEALRTGGVSLGQLGDSVLAEQEGTNRLLLVVDQFEELYTLVAKDKTADRERFIDLLLAATSTDGRLSVVLTMRADFYARALARRDLADRLQDMVVNIGPLSTEGEPISEIEAVIRKPAEAVGLTFEGGLVERILKDVGSEPGNLPLLEFLLTELWRLRQGGQMTNGAYDDLGGVEGAIAARADETLSQLTSEQQADAKRLMLMLVRPGEGKEDTRSRATIPDEPELQALVQRFARSDTRLLVAGDDAVLGRTVEVSHEALIQNWQKLREWIDENRDRLRSRERVRDRMVRWEKEGKPEDLLLPEGLDLEEGRVLISDAGDLSVEDIEDYVGASVQADAARTLEEMKEQREREEALAAKVRLQRWGLAAAIAFVAVLAGLGFKLQSANQLAETNLGLALEQSEIAVEALGEAENARDAARLQTDKAIQEKNRADQTLKDLKYAQAQNKKEKDRALAALSRVMAKTSLERSKKGDGLRGLLLAMEALEASAGDGTRILEAESNFYSALDQPRLETLFSGHQDEVWSAEFSPDGQRIVTASKDKSARVWDASNGSELLVLEGHKGAVWSASFNSDGQNLVTASSDQTARIWDAKNGSERLVLRGHLDVVNSAAFGLGDQRIVTASADSTARIWDTSSGAELLVLRGHEASIVSAAFSPDGQRVVTASADNTARVWHTLTGSELLVLKGHKFGVLSAVFSPDGQRLATASSDNTARIWNASNGSELLALNGHSNKIWSVSFSPDGQRLVTASDDNTTRVWDASNGSELLVLKGQDAAVLSAKFGPDSQRLVTTSSGKRARVWQVSIGSDLLALTGHKTDVLSAAFSPDGQRLVTTSGDKSVRIWGASSGSELLMIKGHEDGVWSGTFSPDGQRLVTTSVDKTARIWDASSGSELLVLKGHKETVWAAAFSSDGRRLATASVDKTARIWDVSSGLELLVISGHEAAVNSVAFSSDGERILTASGDKTARVWNASTGSELMVLRGHEAAINSAAFSPDDRRILTASYDRTARVWDESNGSEVLVLKGHEDTVWSTSFSPDGQRIVTASSDGTARVWDASSGSELLVLKGHKEKVWSAAFSPDGQRLVTASGDNTARVWHLFPTAQSMIDHGLGLVSRCLTPKEREEFYLPETPPKWCDRFK